MGLTSDEQSEHAAAVRPAGRGLAGTLALTLILGLAAWLRLWHLRQAGFGTQYYAAAVLSMLRSWHNFFFNSFDPAGFVSVDKPPLALWAQVASARLLGFSAFSVHLPQALEGVAAVGILYQAVQRRFGHAAALLAALFLAVTPVSIAIDRSNNTDSALVLCLLLAAWALDAATRSGSRAWLLACMGLLGVAFNVKMLAAIVVLPPFVAVYFLGAPLPVRTKAVHLALGSALLVAVSLSWCAAYDLTPPQMRPYAGSTRTNSMLELIIGENGIRRFVRGALARTQVQVRAAAAPAAPQGTASIPAPTVSPHSGAAQPATARRAGAFGRTRGADRVPIGPLRLASPLLADQAGWLYPLALIGLVAGVWRRRFRWPLEGKDAGLLFWAGWTVTYGLVLSFAGGIFHAYYLSAMAPPVCALAGIGIVELWTWYHGGGRRALALPGALLAVVAWQVYISHGYLVWRLGASQNGTTALTGATGAGVAAATLSHLHIALLAAPVAAALAAAGALLLLLRLKQVSAAGWPAGACAAGVLAITLAPATWALGTAQYAGANSPSAQLPGLAAGYRPRLNVSPASAQLAGFLMSQHRGERFLAATLSAQQAAPLILATGQAVMAMGGFSGSDPILTPEQLARMVEEKQLRFVLISGGAGRGFAGRGERAQAPLIAWILQHGAPVASALWRVQRPQWRANGAAASRRRGLRGRRGNGAFARLFDLRPAAEAPAQPQGQER